MILNNGHSVKIKYAPKSKHNDKANFPFVEKSINRSIRKCIMHYGHWLHLARAVPSFFLIQFQLPLFQYLMWSILECKTDFRQFVTELFGRNNGITIQNNDKIKTTMSCIGNDSLKLRGNIHTRLYAYSIATTALTP